MKTLIPKFLGKENPTGAEPVPQAALLNDTQNLMIPVKPGKTYLVHMVNMGAFAGQYVWFEGHNITIVEVDGVATFPAEAERLYISAAQRYSFLLRTKNETLSNYAFVASMDTVGNMNNSFGKHMFISDRNFLTFCRMILTVIRPGFLYMTIKTRCQKLLC